ncbi:MAG TPA: hypothetical protein VN257_06810 [Actinotalea sp.]|nr:hypothetical protein [Actinotalea sp.]
MTTSLPVPSLPAPALPEATPPDPTLASSAASHDTTDPPQIGGTGDPLSLDVAEPAPRTSRTGRLRAVLGARPVVTGAVVAVLAAGACLGIGYAAGHAAASGAVVVQDALVGDAGPGGGPAGVPGDRPAMPGGPGAGPEEGGGLPDAGTSDEGVTDGATGA